MKKRITIWPIVYYLLLPCVYLAAYFLWDSIASRGLPSSLGSAWVQIAAMFFVATPVIILLFMRFSLLKWYVDPFAAAEVPLCLYGIMICNRMGRKGEGFLAAFADVNESLCEDGAVLLLFLIGVFVFGLIASFSIARKNGKSIGYWWITPSEPQPE